ncbi:unnamed protein product [Nezara viridula]|uniref:Transmembrane protein 53 n=1 Tax=Nezara viridula TaxID=85310 RepID=A0A9P0HEJ2_NEZVI|nr:unnamed protein product [Nezara viridula]
MSQVKGKYRFRYEFTKSLELISNDWLSIQERKRRLPLVEMDEKRPLVVLLAWVGSKKIHAYKYADVYLEKGFDVLLVSTSIGQMVLPITGYLATSSNLADFLNEQQSYQPLVIHALSIGCVVWCYTEEKILKNVDKYHSMIDRLAGCIWDSPPNGRKAYILSHVAFKKDGILRVICEKLIQLSLLLTYFVCYKYLDQATHLIFNPGLKLPKLLLISKDDPISQYRMNMKAYENWKSKGFQVNKYYNIVKTH